ncbi:hypothetical protein Q3G72_007391 [Acer saccharum]|nr:hypothetical protein Q3G72_007391 [Acer saccharum]
MHNLNRIESNNVKEWLHSLGIFDQVAVVQDDDEPDDGAVPLHHKESGKSRAKVAMQGYLNHFLGNIDIVNSRECHPHRFGSFAPPWGLIEDGSQAQWFIDGQAAFKAITSSIEDAKSELDALLESKAKQGVQIYDLLYKDIALALKINSLLYSMNPENS